MPNDYFYRATCPTGTTAYIVKQGDTLYAISRRFNTTIAAIVAVNPGLNPDSLQIGQQICLPGTTGGTCPGGQLYTIKAGDTYYVLASRFRVTVAAIQTANPGVNPNALVIGQVICIPTGATPTPTATVTPTPTPTTTPPATRISSPCTLLLKPILASLPSGAEIPTATLGYRQLATNTQSYVVAATDLPEPTAFGNYDAYFAVLNLYDPNLPGYTTTFIRLTSDKYGTQKTTWSGAANFGAYPVVGRYAAIYVYNTVSRVWGPAVVSSIFNDCKA